MGDSYQGITNSQLSLGSCPDLYLQTSRLRTSVASLPKDAVAPEAVFMPRFRSSTLIFLTFAAVVLAGPAFGLRP